MNTILARSWESVRTSYWFVPAVLSLLAAALSALCLWLDIRFPDYIPEGAWWIYEGGPDGARQLLAAIVGSMITVTSVVFSITIVALTLAAAQFGTRLLRNFMRDTGNQVVLGTFIATFIYSLLILGRVRGFDDTQFVPHLSITVGILLVVASVGVLIFFIHHVSRSIQADSVITAVWKDLNRAIERIYPDPIGVEPPEDITHLGSRVPSNFEQEARPIRTTASDYVEAVKEEQLLNITQDHDLIVRLNYRPGDFVIDGSVVMLAWPPEKVEDELATDLRNTLILSATRSITQDVEFGIMELVEIATRALSTGINDPFTAITCIDRLSAALSNLAHTSLPAPYRFDDDGNLRLIMEAPSFSNFADAAFNQIRENAGSNPTVLLHLMEAIGYVAENTKKEEHLSVLRQHAEMTQETGLQQFTDEHDRKALEERFRKVKARVSEGDLEVEA